MMSFTPALPASLLALLPSALADQVETLPLVRGSALFMQGLVPEWMYYVVNGEVLLERSGEGGQTVVLQRVRSGFVAEASMQSAAYHCVGRVTLPGWVCRIALVTLQEALATDSAFALRWIAMLNAELRRLRAQNERIGLKSVEQRLLHLIEVEGEGGVLQVGSGLKTLAGQLCVSHEALYRTLSRLQKQGRLMREPGRLRVMA